MQVSTSAFAAYRSRTVFQPLQDVRAAAEGGVCDDAFDVATTDDRATKVELRAWFN